MTIERKVQLVEMLFYQLEEEGERFKKESRIGCVSGCGKCCTYPDIQASPLEFLPWAFHLFLNGEAENTLDNLKNNYASSCHIFKPTSLLGTGSCGEYKYRGLICRLFGSAASRDKYGNLRLSTCKIIKEGQADKFVTTEEAIAKGLPVPIYTEYYMQLNQIDYHLGQLMLPVNKALKVALEEVLHYYAYRPSPDSEKNCG